MLKTRHIYISLILNKGTIMKKILATLAAVIFSTSTFAADISQLSVGITGNHGLYGADGKEENFDSGGTLERTTKKTAAFVDTYASIFAEYEVNDQVSIGLSYVPMSIETPQNVNSGEGGAGENTEIKVKAEFEDLTTLYLLAKSDMGVYGKFGISTMDINVTSENAGTYADPGSNSGLELAVGYDHEAGDGISVRAEVAYHEFDNVSANNGITDKNEITITDMRGLTGRISFVKSF